MTGRRESGPRKRVVVYCQHLSGAGHFVRSREIVRAVSRRHDVWFVAGGTPVPGPLPGDRVRLVPLTAIRRTADGLAPCNPAQTLERAFAQRRQDLRRLMREVRPDVFMIEHFPFGKWVLREELNAAMEAGRAANPDLRVLSSVRDYPASHETAGRAAEFQTEVVDALNRSFDALLVHADPRVVRLETQFTGVADIAIPVHYTGFVSQTLEPDPAEPDHPTRDSVLVSSGGLGDGERLATIASAAWRLLDGRGETGGRRMVVIAGLHVEPDQYARLQASLHDGPFLLRRFGGDFLSWMRDAALSISQAGYNTTMNVLQLRARAIFAPNRRMTDQISRSRLFAEKGLGEIIDPEAITIEELAGRIESALSRPRPEHDFALDGAERTCDIITALN